MMMLAKMNHAHQEPGSTNVFGYDFTAYSPPSPPPELSTAGDVPLLTNDEFTNSAGFLDGFMTNMAAENDTFDSMGAQPLPNFQGMTSTYGHPLAMYDTNMFANASTSTGLSRQFDTTTFHPNGSSMMVAPDLHRLFPNGLESMPPEPARRAPARLSQGEPTTLGFGSDLAFTNRSYAAPPGQNEATVTNKLMAVVQNFSYPTSAPNSHPESPAKNNKRSSRDMEGSESLQLLHMRKRRQSDLENTRTGSSSDEEPDPSDHQKENKNDRQAWNNYRRKYKGKMNEPKRQNLTETEKRQNHIRSEQKRRNQIKEGFANLLALMPEAFAEGSGNSKCTILAKSVEYLTGLQDGNARLREQLGQFGGLL